MERYLAPALLWAVALGWVVARSTSLRARAAASVLALVSVAGFFGEPGREAVVVAGVLLLLWVPSLPVPRAVVPAVGALAAASMFVYLSHWQVYPPFEESAPWLGLALSLGVGVGVWKGWNGLSGSVGARLRRRAQGAGAPRAGAQVVA
jgi:hypothetical protein